MKQNNYTISETFSHEITIEKSRFITHLFPTDTIELAKTHIETMRKKYADASHNCSAYVIVNDTRLQKSSDDGEPAGTAGVPMLQALNGRDMINITAIVTRYFGGIKLGAGGLIRAYSRAVLDSLDLVPLMTYQTISHVIFNVSYEELNTVYLLQAKMGIFTIDEITYETKTTVHMSVRTDDIPQLEEALQAQLFRFAPLTIIETSTKTVPHKQ